MFPGFPNIMMGSGVQGIIPSEHFKAITYTGDGSSSRAITGVGFEPGFIWAKRRDALASHAVFDVIRGPTKRLRTDTTGAEVTQNGVLSFDADGFTAGDNGAVNPSGGTMVAWCLKAGGAGATNTVGDITSTVSANVDAGFSVVTYTGTGAVATVGHGLTNAPELILGKRTSGTTSNWFVGGSILGTTETLYLNLSNTIDTYTGVTIRNEVTSTTFELGTDTNRNKSSETHVAYCFHSVPGFSKIGSYTGDGGTNNYVELGFRPAFVMVKNTDYPNSWGIFDNQRGDPYLFADLNIAEAGSGHLAFSDEGFTVVNSDNFVNRSGNTLIYLAFAA